MQTNPVNAIREYCLDCCLENPTEVKLCTAERCPLYAFRFGRNPYRAKRTEAQIEAARKAAESNFSRKNTGKYREANEASNTAV